MLLPYSLSAHSDPDNGCSEQQNENSDGQEQYDALTVDLEISILRIGHVAPALDGG
jgi:hypothetical protein